MGGAVVATAAVGMMLSAVLVGIVVAVGGSVVVAAVGMLLSAVLVGIVVAVGGAVVAAAEVGMMLSAVLVGIVVAVGGAAVVAMMVGVALFVLIIKHSILYTSGFYCRQYPLSGSSTLVGNSRAAYGQPLVAHSRRML
jgi:hypothetical protein